MATLSVRTEEKTPVVLQMETPEKGGRGSQKATNALRSLIKGQEVSIDTVARDTYGRSVANVTLGWNSVNKAMQKHTKKK